MKDHEINYLRDKLISEREIASQRLRVNREFIGESNIKEDLNELSSYDNHPADHGSELYEKEKEYALETHNISYLKSIEDSLTKIENGEYGVCESCGKDIDFERLNAHPVAKLCIECQDNPSNSTDSTDLDDDRPIEESVLGYPFGRTFTDDTDNVVYDGEDAWQDVQGYGSSSGPQDISVNRLIDYGNVYYGSEERVGLAEKMDLVDNKDYKKQLPDIDKGDKKT
ncbi:MAG TPA: TraR/DksA C4-type zinc finger protein [Clostridia bacterium]|nr:TraR/DksA C4-type zinc finger protein [Clostridia bacterium]